MRPTLAALLTLLALLALGAPLLSWSQQRAARQRAESSLRQLHAALTVYQRTHRRWPAGEGAAALRGLEAVIDPNERGRFEATLGGQQAPGVPVELLGWRGALEAQPAPGRALAAFELDSGRLILRADGQIESAPRGARDDQLTP